jgi:hypothetical protein
MEAEPWGGLSRLDGHRWLLRLASSELAALERDWVAVAGPHPGHQVRRELVRARDLIAGARAAIEAERWPRAGWHERARGHMRAARRVVVECCPGSVLKRVQAPHQNYKQPTGGPLTRTRRRTRHAILAGLARWVRIGPTQRLQIMRDGGADALDAILAAVGAAQAWALADHGGIARHPRYPREGRLFA